MDENSVNDRKEDVEQGSYVKLSKLNTLRFWCAMISGMIIGVIMLILGSPITGIMILIAGILLCPKLLNKYSWKKRILLIIIAVILCLVGAMFYNGNTEDMPEYMGILSNEETKGDNNKDIQMESQPISDGSRFQVGETVEFKTVDESTLLITIKDWGKCKDMTGKVVMFMDYIIENNGDKAEVVGEEFFTAYADGYHVGSAYAVEEANTVFATELSKGRKADGTMYLDINPDEAKVIEVECADSVFVIKDIDNGINKTQNETSDSINYNNENEANQNSEEWDDPIANDTELWFLDYDSFYHVRVGDELSVCAMNDALLLVSFYGINGDSMDWELDMEPNEIGSDGELIYYYGKDFSLNYYPSDHHIYIETSNDIYSGEYWPNE